MSQAPADAATPQVSAFYDRFPYPGDPLQDGAPPGYNWRWCYDTAFSSCTGRLPSLAEPPRILDAGCGTGVSTDYLAHLNPGAEILAIDISAGALDVARERLRRSGAAAVAADLRIEQRSLLDLEGEGPFDLINSVGVLHHLREPGAGLLALAGLLKPGGLLHLFLYAKAGRWEIHRIQRALQDLGVADAPDAVRLGRQLFQDLPENNRLRRHHEQRWALDTAADANFADMYLHPQETSYDLDGLFRFVEGSGLNFAGFSNPQQWDPARLLQGELLERARGLPQRQQWALVESLDPEISHFEFFLSRGGLECSLWDRDEDLLAAFGRRNPCLWGWPGASLLDPDLRPVKLDPEPLQLLKALESAAPGQSLADLPLGWPPAQLAEVGRQLWRQRLLLLSATP
ncbi:class I SAM-dependent methyltransferase [Synechococcus sp. CS-602]|uniref:class I SAM-dependent methyltransferase n=1 Tax=Synechococcaceae TaxID=1890426 RepID=UPI0008FF5DFB|nr:MULTISPECIES: class I SAM-dependent methyltransferase [Synechococcaceae]MCT4363612.1 class I SAM-dependent methyltransferase [Candidatus Regnicoccus frigidus MAG-AL1]APD48560.1 SAM-dependent methyltransferase [Synechococcus sp. SynAce01]MCT0205369.1 class I SAM-dependent methyltransferase [Synechococcus sp. CS-602]MCT0246863.1 class I SAM-dependent methyltransferase [Synechococcus sp. CS-601]MCT4367301.1 class I SAM-dependent methyltransferase [Candidatus Regnicoccus frigidus MAG-AL2]